MMRTKPSPMRMLSRVFNVPLMIMPSAFQAMLPGLEQALRREHNSPRFGMDAEDEGQDDAQAQDGNILVIPVFGPLIHRGRFDGAECTRLCGYNDIVGELAASNTDDTVQARILLFDTPGGEVAGLFDAVAAIRASAKIKPIHAMVAESAASAGYALASACESISVTQTALTGSIGVYMRHVSMEAWLKNEGYEVTEFFAGAHKTDLTPFKNLPKEVATRFQARIDSLYEMFVALVAENMGLKPEAVVATNADVFMGAEGVDRGLAHRVETLDQMIARLSDVAARSFIPATFTLEGPQSSTNEVHETMAISAALAAALGVSAEATDAQVLDALQSKNAAARTAEHARWTAIMNLPEAAGNERQAIAMAEVPEMTPAAAQKVLAVMPKQTAGINPTPKANEFAAMMAKLGNPDVGANSDDVMLSDDELALKQGREGWAAAYNTAERR